MTDHTDSVPETPYTSIMDQHREIHNQIYENLRIQSLVERMFYLEPESKTEVYQRDELTKAILDKLELEYSLGTPTIVQNYSTTTTIADSIGHIQTTDFNVDRNLNDMLLIYDKFSEKLSDPKTI